MSFSPHRSPAPSVRSSLKKLQQTSVDNKQQKSVEKAKLGDEKDRIIDSLRNELSTLQGKLEMQETTIENLSNYNNQLSANLSRTEKELAEVEVSFKESLQFIQSLHQKVASNLSLDFCILFEKNHDILVENGPAKIS